MASTPTTSARGLFSVALILGGGFVFLAGTVLAALGIYVAAQPEGHASGPMFGLLFLIFGVAFAGGGLLAFKTGRKIYDALEKNGKAAA